LIFFCDLGIKPSGKRAREADQVQQCCTKALGMPGRSQGAAGGVCLLCAADTEVYKSGRTLLVLKNLGDAEGDAEEG